MHGLRDRRRARAASSSLGICNGAQILLEAGLVPGTGTVRRPTAAFAQNAPVAALRLPSRLREARGRSVALPDHGRAARRRADSGVGGARRGPTRRDAGASRRDRRRRSSGLRLRARATARRRRSRAQRSALGCAGLGQRDGNVLAIMPHPERDAWNFNHLDRRDGDDVARALRAAPCSSAVSSRRCVDDATRRRDRAEDSRQRGVYRAGRRCAGSASTSSGSNAARYSSSTTTATSPRSPARITADETIFNPNKHRLTRARRRRPRAAKSGSNLCDARVARALATVRWQLFDQRGTPVRGRSTRNGDRASIVQSRDRACHHERGCSDQDISNEGE